MAGRQKVLGYASRDESGHLSPFEFTRRATGDDDVTFKVTYCGICHTDLHQIRNEWGNTTFPVVPGHEIVGIVSEVGSKVQRFKVGDYVGMGCIGASCLSCDACEKNQEQYCDKAIFTYNRVDDDGVPTYGGYSTLMVANQRFLFRIPSNLPLDGAAPLLVAGITVYSPMKYFGMDERGKRLGVVGLGGVGHMAVKFGKAFGLHVSVISTSPNKEKEAKEVLGADEFLLSKDENLMKQARKSLDYIIDTVSAVHLLQPLLDLLKVNGKLVLVGAPKEPLPLAPASVIHGRRFVAGSIVGGTVEIQEMLDFCGQHGITSTVEIIPIQKVNEAMIRLEKGDVKYRFVVDIANSLK